MDKAVSGDNGIVNKVTSQASTTSRPHTTLEGNCNDSELFNSVVDLAENTKLETVQRGERSAIVVAS
mgnify:CR=1 FL=1